MPDDLIIDEQQFSDMKSTSFGEQLRSFYQAKVAWWKALPKGRRVIITLITLAFVLGISLGTVYAVVFHKESPHDISTTSLDNLNNQIPNINDPIEPQDHEKPFTGEKITETEYTELMQRLPLAVVIENHPDARPQTGLDQADLVFETLAEGGITRFVGVFHSKQPEVVGPVRSVRKYFIDFVSGLGDPLLMHIGGATSDNPEADALGEIQRVGLKSLGVSGGRFWRVDYRYAPHNAYSNTKELWEVAANNGWTGPTDITTWEYKDDEPVSSEEGVNKVQINWNGWGENTWSTIWEWNAERNWYDRSHLGEVHVDAVTGEQLHAKNVIVLLAPFGSANDGTAHVVFDVIGKGTAVIFRDGSVIDDATWTKTSRTSQFLFTTVSGDEVQFNRGNTWLLVAPDSSEVIF